MIRLARRKLGAIKNRISEVGGVAKVRSILFGYGIDFVFNQPPAIPLIFQVKYWVSVAVFV